MRGTAPRPSAAENRPESSDEAPAHDALALRLVLREPAADACAAVFVSGLLPPAAGWSATAMVAMFGCHMYPSPDHWCPRRSRAKDAWPVDAPGRSVATTARVVDAPQHLAGLGRVPVEPEAIEAGRGQLHPGAVAGRVP